MRDPLGACLHICVGSTDIGGNPAHGMVLKAHISAAFCKGSQSGNVIPEPTTAQFVFARYLFVHLIQTHRKLA